MFTHMLLLNEMIVNMGVSMPINMPEVPKIELHDISPNIFLKYLFLTTYLYQHIITFIILKSNKKNLQPILSDLRNIWWLF